MQYVEKFGTHVDLNFERLIKEIHTLENLAANISKSETAGSSKKMISELLEEVIAYYSVY